MNKESRIFIYGMLLLIICGFATAIHITQIANGTWDSSTYNIILFILSIIGSLYQCVSDDNL